MARARNRNAVTLGLVGGLGLGLVSAAWFAAAGVSIPDLTATAAAAGKTEIMPLSEIRPGMKGHAMTVFYGSTPERFEIEIIDVVPDYLPRQDAILFRSPDPRLMHSGIVGGMSGSPIYINGKLVGALAYGYRFNKDPIGGISPIEKMLEVDALPHRPEVLPHPRSGGRSQAQARAGASGWADTMLGLGVAPAPPRRRPADTDASTALVQLEAPLTVSGYSPAATAVLAETLGVLPVRGGSGGGKVGDATTPRKWQAGDSLSVLLTRGDNASAVNGTVTWVGGKKGERLLAFGHPMFDAGPVTIPVADARVHVIIPSFQRSVKLSSPLTMQGTMVQDRQPAIGVRADITAEMVPVITHMIPAEPDIQPRDYHSEVASDTALTPGLVAALLVDAASEAGTDAADLTAVVEHTIALETTKGPRTVKLREEAFFPLGADLRELRSTRGILTIAAVLDNDFEVARIRQVEQTVQLTYGDPVDIIEAVRVTQGEVHAGDLLRVTLDIRRRHGELRTETLDLRVPDDAAGEDIEINITGGAYEQPYRPMPDSLDDLIANIERTYPARSMVATLYREQEGLSTKHGLLRDLPDSVLESLTPAGRSTPSVRFKQMARRVIPTKRLIEGDHTIKLSVLPARSFSQP